VIKPFRLTALALGLMLAAGAALAAGEGPVITLTDGVVSPQLVEVPAGQAVTLTVVNAGTKPAEFESKRLKIEKIVAPGMTVTIELRALPAGEYPFVEEFHEDLETGRGTIVAK